MTVGLFQKKELLLRRKLKMMKKFATILMLVGATLAFPAEEEQSSLPEPTNLANPGPIPTGPLQEPGQDGANPQLAPLPEQIQPGLEPPQGQPGQPQGPESESDLKTDATFWWGRSFYPFRSYRRYHSYYRPRSYSYYTPYYAPYYSNYWSYW